MTPARVTITMEQIEASIRKVIREELSAAGLNIDEAHHQFEAREDFRFLRRLRTGIDGTASKIGWVIIAAVLSGMIWVFTAGLQMWKGL